MSAYMATFPERKIVMFGLAYAVCFLLAVWPLFTVHHPPLQDYPNHFARMFILANPGELDMYWQVTWRPVPNLAMDLIVPGLARWVPLAWAGKVFVALCYLLATSATVALQWTLHRRVTPLALLSFLFVQHLALQKGFLNYCFACGLALWAVVGWIALTRRAPWVRLIYGVVISIPLYFAHLHGLLIFCLIVGGFECGDLFFERRSRFESWLRLSIVPLSALPMAAFYFFVSPKEPGEDELRMGGILEKLAFARYVMPTASDTADAVLSALMVIVAATAVIWGFVRVEQKLVPALFVLGVGYFFLPSEGIGGANIDWRTLVALPFLLLGATIPSREPSLRSTTQALGVVAFICGFRSAEVEGRWQEGDEQYQDFERATRDLPEHAAIVSYVRGMSYEEATVDEPLLHLASYAVAEHGAFYPGLFTKVSQQPIAVQPAAAQKWMAEEETDVFMGRKEKFNCSLVRRYDYVVLIADDEQKRPCGGDLVERVGDIHLFVLADRKLPKSRGPS